MFLVEGRKRVRLSVAGMRLVLFFASVVMGGTLSAQAQPLEFEGRIEAATRAFVYSRVEGRVIEVHVVAGQEVTSGQLLAKLDDDLARLDVQAAEADLMRADALVEQATSQLARAERLSRSVAGSAVRLEDANTALALAQAGRRAAEVSLDQSRVALADTEIRAPISGFVETPRAVPGAILEFDAGEPPLFEIVQLDPVRLVYSVPYSERLAQLDRTRTENAQALLDRIRLSVVMPDGLVVARGIEPRGTSVRVAPETDALEVWADVSNPDSLLRPGMRVTVQSTFSETRETE